MLTHLKDVIMADEDSSSLEEIMQEEVDGIVEEMAVDMVELIQPEEVTMAETNMAHGGERDNDTLEGLGFETGKMAVKFLDVDMRGKDADGKTCVEFHRTMKDGKDISDDEEVTMTEPSSSRDSDNSDQDGSVVVSKVMEDYLEKEDSSSEFSFESSGTLEDDANTLDGFVDLSAPFNMDLLRSCIEKGSSVLEKVRGKDVVVVVGKTGVGKSLFIQGLAGKKIVKVKHQTYYSGETVLRDVFEAEVPIPGFDVGHKKVSKTKSINCFVRKDAGTSEQSMIYVDSPGFEDTSGPEVDISTSVMLSQVAKEARSLRFVVLINYASLLEDRGGAMRSVLKLAHTFVSDFEADKKSFMFLFTHASKVDSPDSLNSARMRLINDIVCILDGTDNPEVEKVLKFIQQSLQKKYKFVDILHPIFSDFNAIAKFAETKLSTVKNPAIVTNCGLTMAAELKLTSQVQYLLLRLRGLLSSENANQDYIQEMKQIQETFRYFKRYIGVDKVQESAGVSESLFEKYLGEQRKIVEEQLSEAGRDCDTATFDDGNVAALRTALYEIAELEDTNSVQYYQKRIDGAFNDSHNKFFCQDGHLSLDEALRELDKLRAWASAFEKFVPAYKKACAVIEENTSATTTNAMRMSSIPSNVTKEELATYVRTLGNLQQQEFARHKLSAHEVRTVQQSDAMEKLKTLLCSLAMGWVVPVTSSLGNHEEPWSSMPSQLQLATRRVAKLEFLQAELVKMQDFATIVLSVSRALGELHSFLTEGVRVLCDDLKSHATQDKFGILAEIISAAIKLPGQRWKDVEIPYKALLEQLKADLKGRFGAIESSAKQTPLKDGEQAAALLLSLLEFKWFDSFVTAAFVESDCSQLLLIYRARFEVVMKEGLAHSQQLSIASKRNTKVLSEVHVTIAEIKQLELFWSAVGEENFDPRKPDLIACLRSYRQNLVDQSKRWSDKWYSHLKSKEFDEARALTETLNAVLEEVALIETFTHLIHVKNAAATAKSSILRTFKLASDYVNAEFDKRANYSKQADCLACIAKIHGFPRTDGHLPSFTVYKEKARSIVSKDAIEIEKLLDESADGIQIATRLNNLEAARVLDPYTNDEATNRMRPLEALRVKRADENEKLLDGMIQRNDFSGMGELIRPLSVSSGLIEKNKFSEYKRRIEKSLKERVIEVQTRLLLVSSKEDVKRIAATIHLLEEASKEIGFMFVWRFNLSFEASDARKKLTARFRTLVSGMTEGCKSRDCYAMAKNHNLAFNIFEHAEPFLNDNVKGSFRESVSEMEKILKDLPKQADGFCASYFQDSSYLEQLLPSLKVASSSRDPELPQMGRLFTEMQDSLAQKSNDVLRSLRAKVDTSGSYDDGIDILNAFQRSKAQWMDGYVTTLPFDLSDLLDEWKEKRAELEREEESQSCIANRFHLNKSRLNELKPCSLISKGINYFFKTYENLQKKLDREGQIAGEQANIALRERDWASLQRSLNVLSLMAKELSEHILEAEGRVRRLRRDILKVFLTLCRMSVSYLKAADGGETDSLVSFQANFPDLRQCVVRFGFVLDDTDAKKEFCLATQLVHDILKSGVSRLNEAMSIHEFSKIRALVVHNRTTGAFFVDHYMLMKEELQLQGILTNEKWLSQLFELCNLHFSDGRDLANIKSCAILGVLPSATEDEVKHAFRQKALEVHPDKKSPGDNTNGSDSGAEFRRAKEASDILTGPRSREKVNGSRFFAAEILKIPADLKSTVRQYLRDQA